MSRTKCRHKWKIMLITKIGIEMSICFKCNTHKWVDSVERVISYYKLGQNAYRKIKY